MSEECSQNQPQPPAVLEVVEVPVSAEGERLDRFVATVFPEFPTKSSARKGILRGEIWLNGEPTIPHRRVKLRDVVDRREPQGVLPPVYDRHIPVHYEDAWMAIVEKPPGIPVVGNRHHTLLHALPSNLSPTAERDSLRQPRPVHRLDWPTGGLVVVAKTAGALAALSKSFEERRVLKEYRAIVMGRLEGAGCIELAIDERAAVTEYEVLSSCRSLKSHWLTQVRLVPHTGRKHQLRKHMLSLGCPILGDVTYGSPGQTLRGKGMFLWAVGITIPHPIHQEPVRVMNEPPPKFASLLAREERRWHQHRGENEQT